MIWLMFFIKYRLFRHHYFSIDTRYFFLGLFLISGVMLYAQQVPPIYQCNHIEVKRADGSSYSNAFCGGLKFALFASMDLNIDGKNDIVVLDRRDNRLLTFINNGSEWHPSFLYRPQFEINFPEMETYFYLKDYNGDHLPDLFTFSKEFNSGIAVYKNKSSSYDIAFEMEYNQLTSLYFGTYRAVIYTNSIDIPVIEDVDGDGDLDILTFSVIGQYMDYYENQSLQKYGTRDSFDFIYKDGCWGKFMEDDLNNQLSLGKYCGEVDNALPSRHAGSTSLLLDLDMDGDQDLLLGDVGYSSVNALYNGKRDFLWPRDSMIAAWDMYPHGDKPIDIHCMPGLFYLDVDNNGIKDLIASGLDMEIIDTFQNLDQIWLYLNNDDTEYPDFSFRTPAFLQEDMIDLGGSTSPAFFDYDEDGDLDLFVATKGDFYQTHYTSDCVWLFENIGDTTKAVFRIKDTNYFNIRSYNFKSISPHFADINGDSRKDLILGLENGKVAYFKNTSPIGSTAAFEFVSSELPGINTGAFSVPFVYDLNGDGLPDMFCGQKNGNIHYYENTGTATSPYFTLVNDTFGGISFPSTDREYSAPVIFDLDKDGKADLLLGTRQGKLLFYPSINAISGALFSGQPIIIRDTISRKSIDKPIGSYLKPAVAYLNQSGYADFFLGNHRGGLLYYSGLADTVNINIPESKKPDQAELKIYPNPADDYALFEFPASNSSLTVSVLDLNGHTVFKAENWMGGCIEFSTSNLKEGVYIAVVSDASGMVRTRGKLLILKK